MEGELEGPGDLAISGVEQLDRATPQQLSFVRDQKFADAWSRSRAGAALVTRGVELGAGPDRAVIRVGDADLAMAAALKLFTPPRPSAPVGVHPAATVDPSARLGQNVSVGPGCVIGPDVTLGEGTVLYANVTILDQCLLGRDCTLYPGVVLRERCELGDRVILHPNVTVGADGFGFRPSPDGEGLVKIPQIGNVRVGHDVEIGASTCIDRGKFGATTIGDGTKIDNLVQVAHNVQIGRFCVIAGQAGFAGSAIVEDGVMIGGHVAVRDGVRIGAQARIAGFAAVMNDVPPGEHWAGYPARDRRAALREHAAMHKLPDLLKTLRKASSGEG